MNNEQLTMAVNLLRKFSFDLKIKTKASFCKGGGGVADGGFALRFIRLRGNPQSLRDSSFEKGALVKTLT